MGHHHGGWGYTRRHVARDDYYYNRDRQLPPRPPAKYKFNDKMTFLQFVLLDWVRPVDPPAPAPAPQPAYQRDMRCPHCQVVTRGWGDCFRCCRCKRVLRVPGSTLKTPYPTKEN